MKALVDHLIRMINYVFDPFIVFAVGLGILCLSVVGDGQAIYWMILLLLLTLGIPLSASVFLARKKLIADVELSSQEDRLHPVPFISLVVGSLLSVTVIIMNTGPRALVSTYLGMMIATLTTYGMTFRYKVSGHSATIAGVTVALLLTLGVQWWPISLLIPVVGGARVWTGAHSVHEVVLGITIGIGSMLIGHWLFLLTIT